MIKKYVFFTSMVIYFSFSIVFTAFSDQPIVPVIFIHKGDSYYLRDSLWQAKQHNSRVILIGDVDKKYEGIEYHDMSPYLKEASYFKIIYQHIAENNYNYELFCFQRWFVLKEFMRVHNISRCFYADSDVMLYCNVTQEEKHFFQHDVVLLISSAGVYSGGISFWSLSVLEDFCFFLISYYENKENLTKWIKWFNGPRVKGTGVCDMTIFTEYARARKNLVIPNIRGVVEGATFDHHINTDEGGIYKMVEVSGKRKIKEIKWDGCFPYGYNFSLKQLIRFKTLHFQGGSKDLMKNFRKSKDV